MRRLLSVHAHPDDESSKGAGTVARYVAEGAQVTIVSCTGGESGDILNEGFLDTVHAARDMAGLRRVEMRTAQQALGADHVWLGYLDSGLPPEGEAVRPLSFATIPIEVSGRPLVRLIRRLRPQVLLTYDERGGYPHPDHIRCHEISMWAVEHAASDESPELGEPWSVSKVYYDRMTSSDRVQAFLADYETHDPDSERIPRIREMAEWMAGRTPRVTTRIDVSEHLDQRDAALRAHSSQVAPDAPFFFWPHEVVRRAWPTEDFELVRSTVGEQLPETDLFAGIDEG
ncbi:mycothiol conjugate amidase Mca [Agrococcus versicolor]|uniref:Mycothiol conjugate amidase Mca n=1 Tax=Agrococcus versicolor TaxID=501482 RepID=A0ABN3ALC8_9MICO